MGKHSKIIIEKCDDKRNITIRSLNGYNRFGVNWISRVTNNWYSKLKLLNNWKLNRKTRLLNLVLKQLPQFKQKKSIFHDFIAHEMFLCTTCTVENSCTCGNIEIVNVDKATYSWTKIVSIKRFAVICFLVCV